MMRKKLLLIVGLIYNFAYSQLNEPLTLPNYTPPSPDAFAITKYGDVTINEFTGMVNQTIPLYTYKAGQLELPISISYAGAGVKVDDLPTWTGINWTLDAGGVITRNVNDIADESSTTRVTMSDSLLNDYFQFTIDGTIKGAYMRNLIENDQIDSEADIFQFSFPGGSGSFYFDENFEPRQVKYDKELKIELTGTNAQDNKTKLLQNKEFVITTTEGIKYYFGGSDATEETSRRYIFNGSQSSSDTTVGVTAFYLTKIEHPISGIIFFEYTTNLPTKIIPIQKIQKMKRILNSPFIGLCYGVTEPGGSCSGMQPRCLNAISENVNNIEQTTVSTRVISPRYLQKIFSNINVEEIYFNSTAIDNLHFKRVLNNIEIIKDTLFKTIDFQYTPFESSSSPFGYSDVTKRFFLTEISFDKDNPHSPNTISGRRNEIYSFEYNNYNYLPERFSFSQDYLGFCNGKPNTTSIPDNIIFNPQGQPNFADRTPVFSLASLGALTKIIYPTGGYTSFDYEGTKAKKKNFKNISLHAYRNQTQYTNPNMIEASTFEVDENGIPIGFNNIYETQDININVTLIAGPTNENSITPQNEFAYLHFRDITTNGAFQSTLIAMPPPSGNMNFSGSKTKKVTISKTVIQGHDYEIKISINPINPAVNSNPTPMEAFVNINYFDGYTVVDNLGVRLKRQTNYASENFPESIKRYYYSTIENINPAIEDIPLIDNNNYGITEKHINNMICNANPCCNSGGSFEELVYQFESLSTAKIDLSNNINHGIYEHVTVSYGGDNFENGGIEKTFEISNNIGAIQIETKTNPDAYTNNNQMLVEPSTFLNSINNPFPKNGTLRKEKYFNNALKKVTEKTYDYDFNQVHRLNNIIGKKEYNDLLFGGTASSSLNNVISNFTIGTYITVSSKHEIKYIETKEYIDPVPLGAIDESTYNKIVTTQNYDYGILRGSPITITENSSDNPVETHFYYPNQVAQLNGLTQLQIDAIAALVDQYKITTPIQVEKYLNGNKQQTTRTLYKIFDNSPSNVFPEIIQSTKGTLALEDRVKINKYDPYGNPSEVQLADGSLTRYYYNSKNQVILKIENYKVSSTLPSGTEFIPIDENTTTQLCANSSAYPDSIVTNYIYQSATDLLIKIIDTNCKITSYEYDSLHRLQYIKDNDGNIVKEFENNYKRY